MDHTLHKAHQQGALLAESSRREGDLNGSMNYGSVPVLLGRVSRARPMTDPRFNYYPHLPVLTAIGKPVDRSDQVLRSNGMLLNGPVITV